MIPGGDPHGPGPDRLPPAQEARFRRLLRWYPRGWRAHHGEALLGTLLDLAEHEGRTSPSAGEGFAAAVNGLGTRLDRRFAFWSALAALAAGLTAIPMVADGLRGAENLAYPALAVLLAPGLAATAVIGHVRQARIVSPARAMLILALAWAALAVAAVAQALWVVGFDMADAGLPTTGLIAGFWQVFGVAVVLGAVAIAALIEAMMMRAGVGGRPVRVLTGGVIGAVAAPAIGLSLITPVAVLFVSIALAISARPRREAAAQPPASA